MQKTIQVLIILLSVGLMTSCISKKKFLELESQKNALSERMDKMQMDMQGQIDGLNEVKASLEKDKESLNTNITSLEKQITVTEDKVKEVEFTLKEKEYEMAQLWDELGSTFSSVDAAVSSSNSRIKQLENQLYLDVAVPEFKSGSDRVSGDDEATLMKLATMLKGNPGVSVIVEGHTDSQSVNPSGKYRDNWDLSVSRATQVVRKLVDMGVNPKQLIPAGRGEHMLKNSNDKDDKDARAANRRTEFVIVPNIGKLYKVYKGKDSMMKGNDQKP